MSDTTFLAYERHGKSQRVTIETAINPDIAGEVDRNLGFKEPDEPNEDLTHAVQTAAARGLSEFIQFALGDQKLFPNGRGVPQILRALIAVAFALHPERFVTPIERQLVPNPNPAKRKRWPKIYAMVSRPLTEKEIAKLVGVSPRQFRAMQREFIKQWGFKIRVKKRTSRRR